MAGMFVLKGKDSVYVNVPVLMGGWLDSDLSFAFQSRSFGTESETRSIRVLVLVILDAFNEFGAHAIILHNRSLSLVISSIFFNQSA